MTYTRNIINKTIKTELIRSKQKDVMKF